jgi:hypothetical protein
MRWRRFTRSDVNVNHRYVRAGQQLASGAIDYVLGPCLADVLLRFSETVMRRLNCPSDASSFSIRTKIRSSDPAIERHLVILDPAAGMGRNGPRAHRQRRSAADCDHSASQPSRQLLRQSVDAARQDDQPTRRS